MNTSITVTLKDDNVLMLLQQLQKLNLIKLVPNISKKTVK